MLGFQRFILLLILTSCLISKAQSTASQQVTSFLIEAPQLEDARRIWVYLPKSYTNSNKYYPVIYMFDGQNVFDRSTSYAGEWKADEFMDLSEEEYIIVAIAHGNDKRLNELTPYSNPEYGGGGGTMFLSFIINVLKPKIDSIYRTKTDSKNTTIAGASLGGLMAFYAVLKYPEVFSKSLALSPSFWINPELVSSIEETMIPDSSRFYIVIGSNEGELMTQSYDLIQKALISKRLNHNQFYMEFVEDGKHNEAFWETQFKYGFNWLLNN